MKLEITVDGKPLHADPGWTILRTALQADVYIPSLCAHPDLPPQDGTPPARSVFHGRRRLEHDSGAEGLPGCGLCVVDVEGEGRLPACATMVQAGMVVTTKGAGLEELRRQRLSKILAHHPHACLTCAQREGCTREPCSMNVPIAERCCPLLGRCELQAVAEYVGIDPATTRWVPCGDERITAEPLFDRDPALCIACGRCVRACNGREVGALGWVRDSSGRRWVGPVAATPVEAGCRFCGSCVEVCPTGALSDRGVKPSEREQALVPCRSACPAHTDVPRYLRLVAAGRLREAAAVVAERAPLVEVLGTVCFHPCEDVCRRNEVNRAPLSICRIKREAGRASAAGWTSQLPSPKAPTGKKVAVVGGGPAGLVAAHVLRLLGHEVTLFEARDKLGGMLAFGIPPFRLARDVVRRETAALVDGVDVRTGVRIGAEGLSVAGLKGAHDAVVVATGAASGVALEIAGERLSGVQPGLAFLEDIARERIGTSSYAGRRVVVVGGGNVAVDCARSALRLGAAEVVAVCLEQPDEMPAYEEEIRGAVEEGVRFRHGWGIKAFDGNGSLERVELKRCTRVFDDQRRFAPQYDETTTDEIRADAVIVAAGQRPDRSLLPASLEGVFLAGDLATGPRSVVEAVASGREVALSADRHLGGAGELALALGPVETPIALGKVEGFSRLARLQPEPVESGRLCGLHTTEPGLGPQRASQEADRCLRCDLRLRYVAPKRPPARAAKLECAAASLERVPAADGVVRFYGADGVILEIVGGANMRQEVADRLEAERAVAFDFEPCPMYTQRQNELLSRYMEAHGRMPPGASEEGDLDGLF